MPVVLSREDGSRIPNQKLYIKFRWSFRLNLLCIYGLLQFFFLYFENEFLFQESILCWQNLPRILLQKTGKALSSFVLDPRVSRWGMSRPAISFGSTRPSRQSVRFWILYGYICIFISFDSMSSGEIRSSPLLSRD